MADSPSGGPRLPRRVEALFEAVELSELSTLRRELHAAPELSFEEHETCERLEAELRHVGIEDIVRVAGTGLVARVPGRDRGAPVVAVRGDIDALPIREATGLPFASRNDGVMHACGHDIHASWAVGAARVLNRRPAAGDVLIVLQPAEEVGLGAPAVLESGALDGARAIFGGHVDTRFEVGEVVVVEGSVNAAADTFRIEVKGRGAHGARPQLGLDPIVTACAIVQSLQAIVARRLEPGLPGVVTVGSIQAGKADNVIPESALLLGTLRSTTPESRELLHDEVERIARGTAQAYGVEVDVERRYGTSPLINTGRETAWFQDEARALLGDEALCEMGATNMGGEDFAAYLEELPGCFARIGAREPGDEPIGAHQPRFSPSEGALFVGAAVLAQTARRASRELLEEAAGG